MHHSDPETQDLCTASTNCASRHQPYSLYNNELGADGRCSACHAKRALDILESSCTGNDTDPLDELWLSLSDKPQELARRIEKVWAAGRTVELKRPLPVTIEVIDLGGLHGKVA